MTCELFWVQHPKNWKLINLQIMYVIWYSEYNPLVPLSLPGETHK